MAATVEVSNFLLQRTSGSRCSPSAAPSGAELALSLIESLDGPADPDVEEAWRLKIERRIGQIERGEVELIPGDEVFARLRRRLG
jgi:putative addiction module component